MATTSEMTPWATNAECSEGKGVHVLQDEVWTEIVSKTEGMALLGDGALALINDDDFGISGGRTQIAVVRGTGIARR